MIDKARLAESVARLDAGTRALLDLSLRRAVPDEQVAKVLDVDAASIPRRRARGIAQLADMMEVPGPAELAALLLAIPDLPEDAWAVPEVPVFAVEVSRARRARAFRRAAVAASPLVALGAVIAAVAVSSPGHGGGSLERSGHGSGGGGGSAGGAPPAAALAPTPSPGSFGLAGVAGGRAQSHAAHAQHERLASVEPPRRHREAGGFEEAVVARHAVAAPHTVPVVLHRAPSTRHAPRHVTHPAPHHGHPGAPPSTPAPSAPPSTQNVGTNVQVSSPQARPVPAAPSPYKPPKTDVPQLSSVNPPGDDQGEDEDDQGGGCGNGLGHSSSHQLPPGLANKGWTPPGLFRKRAGRGG